LKQFVCKSALSTTIRQKGCAISRKVFLHNQQPIDGTSVRQNHMILINHSLTGPPQQTRDANLKALAATFRFIDQTIGKPNTTR
jgi:hypothetical protein